MTTEVCSFCLGGTFFSEMGSSFLCLFFFLICLCSTFVWSRGMDKDGSFIFPMKKQVSGSNVALQKCVLLDARDPDYHTLWRRPFSKKAIWVTVKIKVIET